MHVDNFQNAARHGAHFVLSYHHIDDFGCALDENACLFLRDAFGFLLSALLGDVDSLELAHDVFVGALVSPNFSVGDWHNQQTARD